MSKSIRPEIIVRLLLMAGLILLFITSWLIITSLQADPPWVKAVVFVLNNGLVMLWAICTVFYFEGLAKRKLAK